MMAQSMTSEGPDDGSNDYTNSYLTRDFVKALRALGGSAATKELSEEVGCHRETARRRMIEMEEKGMVTRRDVGDAALWTLVD